MTAGSGIIHQEIVMNTQEQLRQAFDELEQGKFLKRL
jgi:redox-sensitive bicupin YhaK (pirin superfamily)